MTTFQDKLLTKTDCDEAGDYVVPNVLSSRDLVFRPDIGHKLYHHHVMRKSVLRWFRSGMSELGSLEISEMVTGCIILSSQRTIQGRLGLIYVFVGRYM